ncbi:MAG: alpha/beta fold hydrolase [Armatimonadaceae bacterium]|jgi:pimeloyl-ACP methyl ester carboxylesterase
MSFIEQEDGYDLYFEDTGGDGPPVIFIHGWPLSGAMWEYQIVPLSKAGLRCITYDRRGFGQSDKPPTGYDYQTLGDDLADLIEQLDLSNVTLVGFSMGGGEVAEYLTQHNADGRVTKAILVSSIVPYLLRAPDNPDGVEASAFTQMQDSLKLDRPDFLAGFTKTFFGVGMLSSPVSDNMLAANCQVAMQASPIATLDCVHSFSHTDFRAAAPNFNVETLIIHGDADKTVPIKPTSIAAAALIPGAILKVYPGAPHGLHYTHRHQLNADIAEFVTGSQLSLAAE